MSRFRQSLAVVLTTQNKQEKIHQKQNNKLALGKNRQKHRKKTISSPVVSTLVLSYHLLAKDTHFMYK